MAIARPTRTRAQKAAGMSVAQSRAANAGNSGMDIISDPVTGNSYSRAPGGTYSPYTAPKTSITSSSGTSRKEEKKLGADITATSAPSYAAPSRDPNYLNNIDREIQGLSAVEQANINSKFNVLDEGFKGKQDKEVGTTSAGLARIGGYLGDSGSGTGVLLNLSKSHRAELADLESKRQEALFTARKFYTEKKYDLAKEKNAEAKSYEQETYKRQQEYFQNQRLISADKRTIDNQERDDARSVLTNIIANSTGQSFDELSEETRTTLEAGAVKAGYPLDVIKNMLEKPKALAAKIDTLIKDAAKKGAPASILAAISEAGSFTEAATIASPYIASGGGSGTDSGVTVTIPEYDEFVLEFIATPGGQEIKKQIEAAARTNFTPEKILLEMKNSPSVRAIYDSTVAKVQSSTKQETYTRDQKLKLEQAGLLNAPRQKQLDHLYGKAGSGDSRIDSIVDDEPSTQ